MRGEKAAEKKKPDAPRPLTMQEEIAMAKLKKVGDVKVETKAEPPKKKPQTSMMDMLRQQINLRYQQLNKHEDEDSEKEDDDW